MSGGMREGRRAVIPPELEANWKGHPLNAHESNLSYKYHVGRLRNLYAARSGIDTSPPDTMLHPPPWATTIHDVKTRRREHRKRQQGPKAKAKAKPTGPTWDNRFYLDRSLEAWEREERERGRREERRTPSRKRPQSASATLWRRQAPKPKPKTRPDLHVETAMQRRRRARPQSAGGRLRSPEVLIVTEPDPVAADDADALPFTTWDTFMEGPEAWETRAAAREAAAVGPAAAAAEEEEQQQAGEEGEASLQPSLEAIQACGAFAPLSGPEQQVFDAFVQMLKTKDAFASTCLVNLAHVTARSDDLLEFYGGGL